MTTTTKTKRLRRTQQPGHAATRRQGRGKQQQQRHDPLQLEQQAASEEDESRSICNDDQVTSSTTTKMSLSWSSSKSSGSGTGVNLAEALTRRSDAGSGSTKKSSSSSCCPSSIVNFDDDGSAAAENVRSCTSRKASSNKNKEDEDDDDKLLLDTIVGYLKHRSRSSCQAISSCAMSAHLGTIVPLSVKAAEKVESTAAATTAASSSRSPTSTTPTSSSSCLRIIKSKHGDLRTFLEIYPNHFRIHDSDGDGDADDNEGKDVERINGGNSSRLGGTTKKKNDGDVNRRRYAVSLIGHFLKQQQQQRQNKVGSAREGDGRCRSDSLGRSQQQKCPPVQLSERTRKERSADNRISSSISATDAGGRQIDQVEGLLESERRRRCEAEVDRDRMAEQIRQLECNAQKERKRAAAEKRQLETLLESETRFRQEVERLYNDAEEEGDRATEQLRSELEETQRRLEVETQGRKLAEAEESKAQKLLHSERCHTIELERIWDESKADYEASIVQLTKEMAIAQQGMKDEIQRRNRIEAELDKTEKLLAQANSGSLANAKIARQNREILQLQEQLRKERLKNAALENTESDNMGSPDINDFITARFSSAGSQPPRIMKRSDFPVEPPRRAVVDEHRYDGTVNEWIGLVGAVNGSGEGETDIDRRDAEVAVVASSYSNDELQIIPQPDNGSVQIKRQLTLPAHQLGVDAGAGTGAGDQQTSAPIIELVLCLPKGYPSVALEVSAALASCSADCCSGELKKMALDAIPVVAHLCRLEASAMIGKEAVLSVLSRADDWVENQMNRPVLDHNINENADDDEAFRKHAELAVVKSIYNTDRVQATAMHDHADGSIRVSRALSLPVRSRAESVSVLLHLFLKAGYPEDEPIEVETELDDNFTSYSPEAHMCALDALPGLASLCRVEAQAMVGKEAVLHVLSAADGWVESEWSGIQSKRFPLTIGATTDDVFDSSVGLCRMLVYSHHISDQETLQSLKHAASKAAVGGFVKIGRPGFCLVEGIEENCDIFLENLVQMQTKIRTGGKRGSSNTATYCESGRSTSTGGKCLLPAKMCQLEGKDGTEKLRKHCEEVGLLGVFDECCKR